MKTIIYYKSNTGFTKEYAELLKPRIECETLLTISKIKNKDLKNCDNVVFMGPIRNNVILGLSKFLKKYNKMENKNIFVFGVGIEPNTDAKKENVIMANGLEFYHIRLYLLPGGFDLNRYKGFQKKFMKFIFKVASKKHPEMSLISSQSVNQVNGIYLDRMVDVFYKIKQ
jgi:menaquinone-dependent protoporphyrinogen IX oxidase